MGISDLIQTTINYRNMDKEPQKTHEWVELDDGRSIYRKKDEFRFIPDNFGTAPTVMFDSMEPEYHHGICKTIDSRKDWQEADKVSGSATISNNEWKAKRERIPKLKAAAERELDKDRRRASVEALRASRENPEAFEAKMKMRAEIQEQSAKNNELKPLIEKAIK